MPVSSEYLSDLVLDLNISSVERSLDTLDFNKQFALDVANGMCAECCEFVYCLCDQYLD
jgi:hypothetical protein